MLYFTIIVNVNIITLNKIWFLKFTILLEKEGLPKAIALAEMYFINTVTIIQAV